MNRLSTLLATTVIAIAATGVAKADSIDPAQSFIAGLAGVSAPAVVSTVAVNSDPSQSFIAGLAGVHSPAPQSNVAVAGNPADRFIASLAGVEDRDASGVQLAAAQR